MSRLDDVSTPLPQKDSLIHQCLKNIALNWEFLSEFEQHNLTTLPVYLKSLLLSYLSVFAAEHVIDIGTLKVLFLTSAEQPGSTGSEELSQLDLTGYLNSECTVLDIAKYISTPKDSNRLSLSLGLGLKLATYIREFRRRNEANKFRSRKCCTGHDNPRGSRLKSPGLVGGRVGLVNRQYFCLAKALPVSKSDASLACAG